MAVSTVCAIRVLVSVRIGAAALSLGLNMARRDIAEIYRRDASVRCLSSAHELPYIRQVRRGREVSNVMIVLAATAATDRASALLRG